MLQRTRADWPVVLASWVLLASALSLLAAGSLYTDAVTLAGLHRELRESSPADRAIVVRTRITPDRLPVADGAVMPELERVVAPIGGELARVLRSSPYADAAADPETVTDLVVLGSFEGIEGHATIVDGRWAEPGAAPVEATLSEAASGVLGVRTGDRLSLAGRLDPGRRVEVVITGTWRADLADPYWLGEPLVLVGTETSGRFTTRGPLVVAAEDLTTGALVAALDAQWRAIPDVDGFRPDTIEVVGSALDGLSARINAALPQSNQASVASKLSTILDSVDRSVLVTQAGILLLLVQFGVLAGYAVVLVAALLLERRRTETALLRARGAGLGHLSALAMGEAMLIAIPAAIAAPWLAAVLVAAVRLNPAMEGVGLEAPLPGPPTFVVAGVGGLVAVVALTLPTLTSNLGISGVRAAIGRQVGRTLPQRLGLDLALVLLAAIALFQLRLYGAPLTENARGTLGVDPLLVAAPAIGLLGGAVLAIRIVPRLAELAERVLARGRGLVASLGGRQIARRPLRYTRAALLLILAAALGTFASAHAATWARSQADQAVYATGADVRMVPRSQGPTPGWALGSAIRAIPGVTAATPVVHAGVELGAALRDGAVIAVDPGPMAEVIRLRDDASRAVTLDGLATLAAARTTAPGLDIPDGTRRLSLVISSAFRPVEGFPEIPAGHQGAIAAVVVADGDGRLFRIASAPGALGVEHARIEIPLDVEGAGGAVSAPLRIVALELSFTWSGLGQTVIQGTVDVEALEASAADAGEAWTPLAFDTLTRSRWIRIESGAGSPYRAPEGHPNRLSLEGVFSLQQVAFRRTYLPAQLAPLAALAGPVFLERTGARVGDQVKASVFGVRVTIDLVGRVDAFPPQDPAKPFLVVDGLALDLARFNAGATMADTDEWWLSVEPGGAPGVAAALAAPAIDATEIVDREALLADLTGDPLALGVIGILGLGSVAALLFAAIGFLVSATVSTAERLGEFALLKALGLSPRQLQAWLSMESVTLLVIGLVAGTGLGLVLAWLALPFATLTASGEPPVPDAIVVVPLEALLPTVALAGILVVATWLLVRRQLPAARTSAVLRARDE